ncbi:hypothetical protein TRFO_03978 [Tritrichomonas foetus]|uniref:Uncharacterized protein n=1 Tax=Tritrichomonas foetus TaxID=1144522 RepID=A0A1J4KJ01_9EUKA|nr:hypothetical protein TRFO_03978 [Tritrichomonas foetus]|eukprot:OHT11066.1 hypothetical protein TRFO_03978 [Tritrichomonas foetus]
MLSNEMSEGIPLSSYPVRSEELLVIQNDLTNIQDGLDTIVNGNLSRCTFLNQASQVFFDFLQRLYQRGEVLQHYASSLMHCEFELDAAQKEFNSDLINLRIINHDLPIEKEKLMDLKERYDEIIKEQRKKQNQIKQLKNKIQMMSNEHNSLITQVEAVSFGITDTLYDDMGDVNVNVFIEVQRYKEEIEKIEKMIINSQNQINLDTEKQKEMYQNKDTINVIKRQMKNIPSLESRISQVTESIKKTKIKQNEERVKSLKFSTQLNQLFSQIDAVYKDIKVHKKFKMRFPDINEKMRDADKSFPEVHQNLLVQLQDFKDKQNNLLENEKKLKEELDKLNIQYTQLCKNSDYLKTSLASVEIELKEQNQSKNQKPTELDLIDQKFQRETVKNAILNFQIHNPIFDKEDLIQEKKKYIDSYDDLCQQINETELQSGQLRLRIESELMRLNVLEAEMQRVNYYQSLTNNSDNEDEIAEMISKNKSGRLNNIYASIEDIKKMENLVNMKKSRSLIKSQKIEKRKQFYEQSIQNWTEATNSTTTNATTTTNTTSTDASIESDMSLTILNGSPQKVSKKKNKNMNLLNAYAQQLSDAFHSQAEYWESDIPEDSFRKNLVDWAMQVDQVNSKIMSSPRIANRK